MLIARPLTLLLIGLVAATANLTPSQLGGFRQPLADRFIKPGACDQQVVQEQDFGILRRVGTKRRPRC